MISWGQIAKSTKLFPDRDHDRELVTSDKYLLNQ